MKDVGPGPNWAWWDDRVVRHKLVEASREEGDLYEVAAVTIETLADQLADAKRRIEELTNRASA